MNPIILISGSYNIFKDNTLSSDQGIYMISGLYEPDTVKSPIYIGSSNKLHERIQYQHIAQLNTYSHSNPILQRAWDKYGQNNFIWWLLEYQEPTKLLEREQYYLDLFRPFVEEKGGYNIAKSASAPFMGRKHTEESRELMSIKLKGKKRSMETRQKISEVRRGVKMSNWKLSDEGLEKLIKRNKSIEQRRKNSGPLNNRYGKPRAKGAGKQAKEFKLISPTNELFEGANISKFARDHGLTQGNLSELLNGKILTYKGWRKA